MDDNRPLRGKEVMEADHLPAAPATASVVASAVVIFLVIVTSVS